MTSPASTPESLLGLGVTGPVNTQNLFTFGFPNVNQNPTVTPGNINSGSLSNTMTTPQQPTPPAPVAPAAPQGQQPGQISAQTAGTPETAQMPTQSNPFALSQVMSAIQSKITSNNTLMSQRNLLLKQLYGGGLTDAEKQQLDPTFLNAINSNDRNQIDMSLRLISDEVAGRTGTLDQSVQYLTSAYNTAQQQLETNRQNAISNVQNFVQQYGSNAGAALKALYGPDYIKQLSQMGIDLPGFEASAIPTITQERYQAQYGGGSSISIPQGTLAAANNNPGNLRFVGQAGATQGQGGFAAFSTPEAGFQALVNDIVYKQSGQSTNKVPDGPNAGQKLGPNTTLEDMIRIYAPTSDGNDPVGYAKHVAQQLGVTPQTAISQIDPQDLAAQIAMKESSTKVTLPDVQAIAKGIENGSQPPVLTGLYSKSGPVRAQLSRDGFDLSKATLEWNATQAYVKNANSTQQIRLKQAIDSVQQAIPQLKKDAADWNAGGFAPLNKVNLTAALNGVYGNDAQKIAASFQQQSTIIQDELGQTFMGGNSPTDKALSLAGKMFDTSWSYDTLASSLDQLSQNLTFRQNAINTVQIGGLGTTDSRYAPAPSGGSAQSSGTTSNGITYTIEP